VHRIRPQLRWFSRLALGVLLALALVPSVSRALAERAAPGPWSEYCSSVGTQRFAAVALSEDSGPALASAHIDHCPLCGNLNGPMAPPPAQTRSVPASDAGSFEPPLFAHAPRPLFAWRTAQPRGPPARA
jgi:hypothetical protein